MDIAPWRGAPDTDVARTHSIAHICVHPCFRGGRCARALAPTATRWCPLIASHGLRNSRRHNPATAARTRQAQNACRRPALRRRRRLCVCPQCEHVPYRQAPATRRTVRPKRRLVSADTCRNAIALSTGLSAKRRVRAAIDGSTFALRGARARHAMAYGHDFGCGGLQDQFSYWPRGPDTVFAERDREMANRLRMPADVQMGGALL